MSARPKKLKEIKQAIEKFCTIFICSPPSDEPDFYEYFTEEDALFLLLIINDLAVNLKGAAALLEREDFAKAYGDLAEDFLNA